MSRGSSSPFFSPRILRSHDSDCWGRELDTALTAYGDEWLRELAGTGFDAIWVRIDLRDIVSSRMFPRVSRQPSALLNRLVQRASRHGVRVFVYLNEPKPLHVKDPFWKKHPGLKGLPCVVKRLPGQQTLHMRNGTFYRMCTSHPEVREFLEESSAALFRETPGLGGALLINASETATHCYSHYSPRPGPARSTLNVDWQFHSPQEFIERAGALRREQVAAWRAGMTCPRCADRDPIEVTAEVIGVLARGIHAAAPRAPVIVWTWSWYVIEPDPQPKLIGLLPKDVTLMSDWERGGVKNILGRPHYVDEYSFSFIGPSPRFLRQTRLARRRGLKVMAKMMVGATHEFAAVPYLPLQSLLAAKMARLRRHGIDGYLGCWNFGGDLNPMSRLAGRMSRRPVLTPQQALRWLARTEYKARRPAALMAAWRHFGRGWQEYPFGMSFVYRGPMCYAPAFPFAMRRNKLPLPSNWLPLPRDRRGRIAAGFSYRWLTPDIMEGRYQRFAAPEPAPFDADVAARALEALLEEWERGVSCYREAIRLNGASPALAEEFRLAQHIGLCLRSTVHIIRFYTTLEKKPRSAFRGKLRRLLAAELKNVIADRALVVMDERLGYHPEAHQRLFTVQDLDWKIAELQRLLGDKK